MTFWNKVSYMVKIITFYIIKTQIFTRFLRYKYDTNVIKMSINFGT